VETKFYCLHALALMAASIFRLGKIHSDYGKYTVTYKSFSSNVDPQGSTNLLSYDIQPDTSLQCKTTDMRLVRSAVCPFTSQLSFLLTVPTHRGMASLISTHIPRRFTSLPIPVLTGSDVE